MMMLMLVVQWGPTNLLSQNALESNGPMLVIFWSRKHGLLQVGAFEVIHIVYKLDHMSVSGIVPSKLPRVIGCW